MARSVISCVDTCVVSEQHSSNGSECRRHKYSATGTDERERWSSTWVVRGRAVGMQLHVSRAPAALQVEVRLIEQFHWEHARQHTITAANHCRKRIISLFRHFRSPFRNPQQYRNPQTSAAGSPSRACAASLYEYYAATKHCDARQIKFYWISDRSEVAHLN